MLELKGVNIDLGEFALRDADLSIGKSDYFCLIGPTGAGKTILLECVAGLLKPPSGVIRIDGTDISSCPPEERNVGYVPQDYALFPHMSVEANIGYGLVERGVDQEAIAEKTRAATDLLRISHLRHRRPSTLSGGEAQRVALARALVLECRVLLLDEPFGALDVTTKRELLGHMEHVHRVLGITVVHVTHDFGEALTLATHVGVVESGYIRQVGTVQEVFTRPSCRCVAELVGIPNIWAVDGDPELANPLLTAVCDALGTRAEGGASLCIRPEQVLVTTSPPERAWAGAEGTIRHARWHGPTYELTIDVGAELIAVMSTRDYADLAAQVGARVHVSVDESAVHVMEPEPDTAP